MEREEPDDCCRCVHRVQAGRHPGDLQRLEQAVCVDGGRGRGGTGYFARRAGSFGGECFHRISKGNALFFAKKALMCDPKIPVKKRIRAFYASCVSSVLHGAGERAYTQSMMQALRIWELGKLRRVLCLRRTHEADGADDCQAVAEA